MPKKGRGEKEAEIVEKRHLIFHSAMLPKLKQLSSKHYEHGWFIPSVIVKDRPMIFLAIFQDFSSFFYHYCCLKIHQGDSRQ